jgi:regulator of cell morphogenesis and NO signaling
MEKPESLDLTAVEPLLWHPAILARCDALRPGQQLIVNTDVEARPLYHLLNLERGKNFSWTPLETGPERWITRIVKGYHHQEAQTLARIISQDYRKAAALKNLGIDFSCAGHTTLDQAFEGKETNLKDVMQEWATIDGLIPEKEMDFLGWNMTFLTKYIIQLHHGFVSTQTKFISELAFKVADSNRSRNPEIGTVADLFAKTGRSMEQITQKEEKELFPYILSLSDAETRGHEIKAANFAHIAVPIAFLQAESEKISAALRQIRELTNHYIAPRYSSSTCPILYKLLAAYEEDALLHLHLENNILYPKAVEAEHLLRSKQQLTEQTDHSPTKKISV